MCWKKASAFQGASEMRNSIIEDTIMGPAVYSAGDEFVEAAREATSPAKQLKLAQQALKADLDCIDAYILISHQAQTVAERLALLREATLVGERLWKAYIKRKDMAWWSYIGTRPFMRALHEYGLTCIESGDVAEAESVFQKLLKLNPNDNQGIRELLLDILLTQERFPEVEKLLGKYPGDFLIGSAMAKFACMLASGNIVEANAFTVEINKRNPVILAKMLDCMKSKTFDPLKYQTVQMVTIGSAEEAMEYICHSWDFWSKPNMNKKLFDAIGEAPVTNDTAKVMPITRKPKS
jgi:tetratricopeptide (TPR) repeat protein